MWSFFNHISATSASISSLLLDSSFNFIFCLRYLFSFLNVKFCTFKFPTCLNRASFLFNFDWALERATHALSLAGFHSLKCFMILSYDILFYSLCWMIWFCTSPNCLFIHLVFFSPSLREVGCLSLAASLPCIFELFFLAEDLVRGVVGLDKTMVLGIFMDSFLFDLSFLGYSLFCGVCS